MDQMKEMVRDANPGTVRSVAAGWARLEKDLVGPGGVKEILETAVEHVMAHWEGQSADLFQEQARIIGTKLTDSSKYAHNVSQSLTGAAVILEKVKPEVLAMEKPGKVSSAADFIVNGGDRSGGKAADDAIKGGASSQEALDSYGTSLSEGREAQLRMAAKMEVLGAAYNSRAAEIGSWKQKAPVLPPGTHIDDHEDFPGDPGGVAPAPVVIPAELAPRSPKAATPGTVRGAQVGPISSSKPVAPPSGVTGGAHKPTVSQPQVGTAIDGISGGRTGAPGVGGVGPVGGGSAVGGGIGGGAGFVGGAVGGAAGAAGAARGMAGRAGGIGGAAGAGAAARGGAARAGGAAGRSGGVVGGTPRAGAGAGAGAGRGTTGGSGLHSSRGAAGGGGASAVRKGGVAGAPGSRTGRRKDEEQREGERPDYLVEDEETWTPQTNTAPRVIE
ncbi:hypothetical protein ABZT02_20740 [Streptomyces sp. NPDC005402]|uniref:hypothetical protein n=1 Tax=Streptomyces sp. NPDC005402 TaxID=3155338 RepID=UPI0033B27E52